MIIAALTLTRSNINTAAVKVTGRPDSVMKEGRRNQLIMLVHKSRVNQTMHFKTLLFMSSSLIDYHHEDRYF